MNLVDYTGYLNNHVDYVKIINKINNKCDYIEIVILEKKESNEFVDKFSEFIIEKKKVKKWWGTELFCKKPCNNLYKIKYNEKIYLYLLQFETFCKYFKFGDNKKSLEIGDYSEITDFGIDDIAFYDRDGNTLLNTTTHEGYITINEELI